MADRRSNPDTSPVQSTGPTTPLRHRAVGRRTSPRLVDTTTAILLALVLGGCSSGQAAGSGTPAASVDPVGPDAAAPAEAAPSAPPPAEVPTETPAAEVPAETPAEAPAEQIVGTPFTADMGNGDVARITIVTAERVDSVSTTLGTPAENGTYLLLDVLWETEAGETSSNPFYFGAKDAEGRSADLDLFADGQLGSGLVLPGDKSRGFVAFDVAAGPVTVTVSDPLMQEAARINIPG